MEQNMVLKLMRVREGAIIPKQATAGSAGYDLCACMDAPQTIEPGERCVFPSGLAAEIPAGTAGFIFTRSGLGIKKGIHVTNGVGVIDSDYRGEIQIGVPEESMPPFEENLSGKILEKEDGSRLYILVSTQEKRVYFVQITV